MKTKNILTLFILSFSFIQADYIEGRWSPGGFSNTMYEFVDGLRYTYYCPDKSCDSDYWDSLDTSDAIPTPNPYWVDGNTISIDLHFGNTATYTIGFRCDGQVVDFYYDEDDWGEGLHSSMFRFGFDYTNSDCSICSNYDEVYCSWIPECQWENSDNMLGGGSCIDNTNNSDWDSYCEQIYTVEDCTNNSGCFLEYDNSNNSFCQGYDDDNLNFSLLNETLDQYMEAINLLDLNVIDGIIGEVVFEDSDDLDFGDNIGLLDFNGGTGFNDCEDVVIENLGNVVVVGLGKWFNESLSIPIYSHINDCNLSPITYPGFIEGNPIYFYAWDDSGENFRQLIPEGRPEYNFTTDFVQVNNINFIAEDGGNLLGDVNSDQIINVLDIVFLINFIIEGGFIYSGDMNQDNTINVQDIVLLVQNILNPPLDEECFIIPEIGPCDAICPTYFYNQNTNQCEEFITGCCGVEAFDTMEECQNNCE